MRYVLTVIGAPDSSALRPDLVTALRDALADSGGQIGATDWLAPGEACDIPFDGTPPFAAETAASERASGAPVDLAVQAVAGRRKDLLVADMESTIIGQEMVDELAAAAGLDERIAAITARTMAGELDFAQSLRQRVALLTGLPTEMLEEVAGRITLNSGARTLIRTLHESGVYTVLVSGGFTVFAERVGATCGFDETRANRLCLADGRLTGEVAEPILGREAKQAALVELAGARGLPLAATLAVGDGANDLAMLETAGLGVAYRAKPILREAARVRIDHGDLTALLYLQGYRQADFRA